MKMKELREARRYINRVLAQWTTRLGPDQRDGLQKARRELDKMARSGKLDRKQVFRVTQLVSQVLLDVLEGEGAKR